MKEYPEAADYISEYSMMQKVGGALTPQAIDDMDNRRWEAYILCANAYAVKQELDNLKAGSVINRDYYSRKALGGGG